MKENDVAAESGGGTVHAALLPLSRRSEGPDVHAPDGSEIRLLTDGRHGASKSSVVEVTLAAGQVSRPVYHRTVEETWYILEGQGWVWRLPAGCRGHIGAAAGGVAGRCAGDTDGVALPVRCGTGGAAAVPVPHDTAMAGRGRGGGGGGAWRSGSAHGVARQFCYFPISEQPPHPGRGCPWVPHLILRVLADPGRLTTATCFPISLLRTGIALSVLPTLILFI